MVLYYIIFQVKETPQKEPEKEKKTAEAIPAPAATNNQFECEKCGKVYHPRHAYHYRNHMITCQATAGQEEGQKKSAPGTPVTPSTSSEAGSVRATPPVLKWAESDLCGTCANCGKQYLKRNTHHYQSHILK